MSEGRLLTRHQHDSDRVQPDARCLHAVLSHPQRGELSKRSHLGVRDRLKWMAETKATAAFHFTEDQC
jgi:hypothetical protein